ncbi:hypothetical protein IQ07DRAFT_621812 [Pyrenochaeta sp. DS3sAY3a]|nr:hypothetical protein IQ07DRAFT_621812 [Pyrenochaeta sp. DS3sAY3a]
MTLRVFGPSKHNAPRNAHLLAIRILWTSWCDVVVARREEDHGVFTVEYRGLGLTQEQRSHIAEIRGIQDGLVGMEGYVAFFGSAMHEGLRGYVHHRVSSSNKSSEVILFASNAEMQDGQAEIQRYALGTASSITDIRIASAGNILFSTIDNTKTASTAKTIYNIQEFAFFRAHLTSPAPLPSPPALHLASFTGPQQWVTNATTSTILDQTGQIHTSTSDPRYSKCLGRPWSGTPDFENVAYLSETRIVKVVSGGYMSAAISAEGELFLWGQACPGARGELCVLEVREGEGEGRDGGEIDVESTGIAVEGEQDDLVKCLTVRIQGQEARVYDVAVGHGHILVAAEAGGAGEGTRRAVFAAGDNERGQLGLGTESAYVREFAEVLGWRDRKVVSLHAAGWSSFAILH